MTPPGAMNRAPTPPQYHPPGCRAEKYKDENVMLVAHGTVITLFVAVHAKIEPFAFWKRLGLPSFVVMGGTGLEVVEVIIQA